ncbi:MAG: ADP-forming succinate--CoA ligase subunit beta [Gammaproteobacteria bacterium]|nr:ADP-forming succinate--CoA ligase subunit beta [Gammaproteobacteria bacterium]
MHIHEYQAKEIFKNFGISVPKSCLVLSSEEVEKACQSLGGERWVVKAQVHSGARGKAGGVKLVGTIEEAKEITNQLIGSRLVTNQTDSQGLPVEKILIESPQSIDHEFYLSLLVDRQSNKVVVLASTEGGMDIESVAKNSPEKIIKIEINSQTGLTGIDCQNLGKKLNLSGSALNDFAVTVNSLYQIFIEKDASLIEINPLIKDSNDKIIALDAKIDFDDNALYRQEEILSLRDSSQEDERELEASLSQLNYISLDGNIGCMVNGAGLAMATMDLIQHFGGSPANFLDVGGGTTAERVSKAFELIQSGQNVKGILVNIFGGIVRCDLIAEGIIQACEKVGLNIPTVVRLEGTNADQGLKILKESSLDIEVESDLNLATQLIISKVS